MVSCESMSSVGRALIVSSQLRVTGRSRTGGIRRWLRSPLAVPAALAVARPAQEVRAVQAVGAPRAVQAAQALRAVRAAAAEARLVVTPLALQGVKSVGFPIPTSPSQASRCP